ncbi:MAG: hypothetical protein C4318_04230 [Acidimicrobiia bacterium]
MTRSANHCSEQGSALVEVILVGMALALSLAFSIAALSEAQRVALAVSAASRDAARSASVARFEAAARESAVASASGVLRTYGLDPSRAHISLEGRLARGSSVEVAVTYPLQISLGGALHASLPITVSSKSRFEIGPHSPVPK